MIVLSTKLIITGLLFAHIFICILQLASPIAFKEYPKIVEILENWFDEIEDL